jgi:hypothetical protein
LPLPKLFTPIQYASPLDICTAPGFQELEEQIKSLEIEGLGYCQMWSLFVMEALLKNPTLKTVDIMNECYRISENDPLYLKNLIRGYTSLISEEILRHHTVDLKHDDVKDYYKKKYLVDKDVAVESAKKRTNTSDQRVVAEPEGLIQTEEHKRREFIDETSDDKIDEYFNRYLKFIVEMYGKPELQTKFFLKDYLDDIGTTVEDFKRTAETFIQVNKQNLTQKVNSLGEVPFNKLFKKYFPDVDASQDKKIKVSLIVNQLSTLYTFENFEKNENEILVT